MNFFKRLFKKDYQLDNPSVRSLFQSLQIGDDNYISAVRNAIDTWGLYSAKAKFRLYERKNQNSYEIVEHPALTMFKQPNPYHYWFQYAYRLASHFAFFGVAYFKILRNKFGQIIGYQQLLPSLVTRVAENNEYLSYYVYYDGVNRYNIKPEDIIEVQYPNPISDTIGKPIISSILNEITVLKYQIAYTEKFYKEGGFMGLTFTTKANLTTADFKKLREALELRYGKESGSFKIGLMDNDTKPLKSAYSMKDMDIKDIRSQTERSIYNAFKVGDILVGNAEASNRSNADAVIYQFTSGVIDPLLYYLDDVFTRHIQKEYNKNYYIMHDSLAPKDQEANLTFYESGLKNGWLSIDEVRDLEGYNKLNFEITKLPTVNVGGSLIRVDKAVQIDTQGKMINKKAIDGFDVLEKNTVAELKRFFELQRRRVLESVKLNFIIERAFSLETENLLMWQVLEMQIFRAMEQGAKRMFSSYGLDRVINRDLLVNEANRIGKSVSLVNTNLLNKFSVAKDYDELVSIMDIEYSGLAEEVGLLATNSSWNYGSYLALKNVGAKEKIWVSTIDERTRRPNGTHLEDHVSIHLTKVGIDEPFVLPSRSGYDSMMYPCDVSGSPENIINCRCKLGGEL